MTVLSEREPGISRMVDPGAGSRGEALSRQPGLGRSVELPSRSLSFEFASLLLAWSEQLETREVTLDQFMQEVGA